MKRYRVDQVSPVLVTVFVEADDEDDALQQAAEMWVEQAQAGAHFAATEVDEDADVRL